MHACIIITRSALDARRKYRQEQGMSISPLHRLRADNGLRVVIQALTSTQLRRGVVRLQFQLCSPSLRVEAKPPHKPQNLQKCNVVHVIIGDDGEVLPVTHRILTPDFIDTWERADTTNTERYS